MIVEIERENCGLLWLKGETDACITQTGRMSKHLLLESTESLLKTSSFVLDAVELTEGKWLTFSSGFFCVTMPSSPSHSFLQNKNQINTHCGYTHEKEALAQFGYNLLGCFLPPTEAKCQRDDHRNREHYWKKQHGFFSLKTQNEVESLF